MNWRLGIGSVEHVLADSDGEGDGRRGVRDRVRRAGRRTGARAGGGTGRHNGSTQTALWACTLLCTRCIHVSCTNRLEADTHTTGLGPGGPSWLPYSFVVLLARARPRKAWGKAKAYAYGLSATHRNAKLCLNADTQRAYNGSIPPHTPATAAAVAGAPALSRDARARPRRRRAPASTLRLRGGSHRGADRRTDTHHSVGPPDAPSVRVARPHSQSPTRQRNDQIADVIADVHRGPRAPAGPRPIEIRINECDRDRHRGRRSEGRVHSAAGTGSGTHGPVWLWV